MLLSRSERMIKKRRELLAAYISIGPGSWRRVYPEIFYTSGSFVNAQELGYMDRIYEVFRAVIDGYRKTLIEDEINLMYMDIESTAAFGRFSEGVLMAIRGRLDLKKQAIRKIEALAAEIELDFPDLAKAPPHIRFRLESTVYLVRLLAYGLFSNNDIVLERVAEVFDVAKLQAATRPKDRRDMDSTLRFLYRGLIRRNERGRQGSRHAARQTLARLREWYPDNEYVIMCIEEIEKYV